MLVCATGSQGKDAVPSPVVYSEDTPETVVVRCGGGSRPEVGCGLFSAGQQLCTGF